MLEIYKKEGLYGITDNGNYNVPFVYENKEDAISEWRYFEVLNLTENFLYKKRTMEEIDRIVKELTGA